MTTATAQETFQGSESPGEILGDINTFGGRLHRGLVVVPGLDIRVMFPLHHWEGAQGGGGPLLAPEWQVNKGTESGYCQVCVYLFDNFSFFGTTPPTVTGVPIVHQVCKMMSDSQRSVNVRMPKANNSNEHGDALATMACEQPTFILFGNKRVGP